MDSNKLPVYRIFTLLALSFLIGIGIYSYAAVDYQTSCIILTFSIIALLTVSLIGYFLKSHWTLILSLTLAVIYLGVFYFSYFQKIHNPALPFGQEIRIEGIIDQKPQTDYKSQQIVLKVTSIDGKFFDHQDKILVKLPHYPVCYYGDSVKFTGTIEKPQNFSGFNYENYLKKSLIFSLVNSPKDAISNTRKLNAKESIIKTLYVVSDKFEQALNSSLSEPDASFAAGLILGIKRNIPDDLTNALSSTGLTHVIALSGYNVTIIMVVLVGLLGNWFSRKQVFLLGFILILLFVIMSGAASSVVRAAIFSLCLLFGKLLGRKGDFTNLMLLAAVVMVLLNPYSLIYDLGFQLSFLAFAGLIYLSPIIGVFVMKTIIRFLPKFLSDTLTETLSAQLAVFPLLLFNFGVFSLIAPLSNLLVLWLVPTAMLTVFLTGLFGIIYLPLGKIAAVFAWPCLEFIIKTIMLMSRLPFASFVLPKSWLYFMLYPLILGFSVLIIRKFKIKYAI